MKHKKYSKNNPLDKKNVFYFLNESYILYIFLGQVTRAFHWDPGSYFAFKYIKVI